MTARRHVVVHGTVQGVGFRYSAVGEAQRLGVSGWVRNRLDGTVEAEIQGSEAVVEQMLAWLRSGPRWAEVTGCDVMVLDPIADAEEGFEVR